MLQKLFLFLMLLFGASAMLYSQPYISASAGYGFPNATGTIYRSGLWDFVNIETHGTYGQGNKFSIAPGYQFNSSVAFELEATYSKGHIFAVPTADKEDAHLNYFSLAPTFVIRTQYAGIMPYIKYGVVVAFSKFTEESTDTYGNYLKAEMTGNPSVGFVGKLGAEYSIRPFWIFIEGGYTALSWKPAHVKVNYNGTTFDIKVVDADPATEANESRPDSKFPLSNFSLMLGIKYEF